MTNEQSDVDFLRELAHYTSTLSPENEARVRRIADLLDTFDIAPVTVFIVEVCINGVWVPDVDRWFQTHPEAYGMFVRRAREHRDEEYRVAIYARSHPRQTAKG